MGGLEEEDKYGSRGRKRTEEAEGELTVNASENLDDYTWKILHNGHMGLEDMLHGRKG